DLQLVQVINFVSNFGAPIPGSGVGGCYAPPIGVIVTQPAMTPITLRPGGGLAPALLASQASLPTDAINSSLKAAMYGFQVGYNHQFLQRFVGGFEADFHVARGASDLTLNSLTGAATIAAFPTKITFIDQNGIPDGEIINIPTGATTITTNF